MESTVRKWQEIQEEEAEMLYKPGDPIWDIYFEQWKDKKLFFSLFIIIKSTTNDEYELVEKLTELLNS
tara:strand:- start:1549 stop:1752 length:204 start_codon:yes stop_codon:yes gene_type:complete